MSDKKHERRIYVPPGHELRRTGGESVRSEGVDTRISYFEVVDPSGGRVGRYVIREARATDAPFAASVTVEAVE
ncbi:hypothetical protein J2X20_000769 [Pelomonas saccharophila]|uniref:Uncharacterized protein n=1 Tax=Roseateles saccharophilus TaxID=304 RepID=A0ABU1YH18_ROSSA|nr:hypothetical protein [Roseateles saccharophilus]MDR7268140.1 hypothetical protein [Roseateles saccharophilus]